MFKAFTVLLLFTISNVCVGDVLFKTTSPFCVVVPVTIKVPLKAEFTRLVRPVMPNIPLNDAFTRLVRPVTVRPPYTKVVAAFIAKEPVLLLFSVPPVHTKETSAEFGFGLYHA